MVEDNGMMAVRPDVRIRRKRGDTPDIVQYNTPRAQRTGFFTMIRIYHSMNSMNGKSINNNPTPGHAWLLYRNRSPNAAVIYMQSHHIISRRVLLAVGCPLTLDAVLDDPGMLGNLFQRDALLGVEDEELRSDQHIVKHRVGR